VSRRSAQFPSDLLRDGKESVGVKSEASMVTDSCDNAGFAKAVERHVPEIAL